MITIADIYLTSAMQETPKPNFNRDTPFAVHIKNVKIMEYILIGGRILEELRRLYKLD